MCVFCCWEEEQPEKQGELVEQRGAGLGSKAAPQELVQRPSGEEHVLEQLGKLSLAEVPDSRKHCCKTLHSSFPRWEVVPCRIDLGSEELREYLFPLDHTWDVSLPLAWRAGQFAEMFWRLP